MIYEMTFWQNKSQHQKATKNCKQTELWRHYNQHKNWVKLNSVGDNHQVSVGVTEMSDDEFTLVKITLAWKLFGLKMIKSSLDKNKHLDKVKKHFSS